MAVLHIPLFQYTQHWKFLWSLNCPSSFLAWFPMVGTPVQLCHLPVCLPAPISVQQPTRASFERGAKFSKMLSSCKFFENWQPKTGKKPNLVSHGEWKTDPTHRLFYLKRQQPSGQCVGTFWLVCQDTCRSESATGCTEAFLCKIRGKKLKVNLRKDRMRAYKAHIQGKLDLIHLATPRLPGIPFKRHDHHVNEDKERRTTDNFWAQCQIISGFR